MSFEFIQPRVDLAVVECLQSLTNRFEQQWFGINLGINSKDIEDNPRRRAIVSASYNITITYNEEELAFIIVIQRGQGINSASKRFFVLGVTRYLAKDELVLQFRVAS